jgi:hypothetical protein
MTLKKFNKTYNEILNKSDLNKWHEPYIGGIPVQKGIYYKEDSYLNLYKALICEEYNIFPVPRLLLSDMLTFALNNDSLSFKKYSCENILKKYMVDWKYYNQFKENIQLMLKENCECSITLVLFNNFKDLKKIFQKFKNDEVEKEATTHFNLTKELDLGIAYSYNDKFSVCLLINCSIKDKFILSKTIQHELIHWMQIALNSKTGKTYGKFKNKKLSLHMLDKMFLLNLNVDEDYLLDEYEFEPWVANTIEEFIDSNLTIEEYENIIKNRDLFSEAIKQVKTRGKYEMFVFGQLCYLASQRKNDDYWYYLIEAMKEN